MGLHKYAARALGKVVQITKENHPKPEPVDRDPKQSWDHEHQDPKSQWTEVDSNE